jgi:hypothetical protein
VRARAQSAQLRLAPARGRRRRRHARPYQKWTQLFYLVDGLSTRHMCSHGSTTFALGPVLKDGMMIVCCTFGYFHEVPNCFRVKPWDEETR